MPAAPDPTLEFARRMDDPTAWVVNRRVPLFKAHERHFPAVVTRTGETVPARTVRVTGPDLYQIAAEVARLERLGVYGRITPGHIAQDRPETDQPPVYGFYRLADPPVGPFGPAGELAVLVDEYLYPEYAAERGEYPYRSADYYPDSKQIFGMAVLKRRPALDLGTVAYEGSVPVRYQYAMGDDMPAAAMGPENAAAPAQTPAPAGAAQPAGDTFTPEEEAQYARMCRYMRSKYQLDPNWPGKGEAAPDAPDAGAAEGDKPVAGDKPAPADATRQPDDDTAKVQPMQSDLTPAQYQAAVARAQGLELELEHERCKVYLYQLEGEGFRFSDDEKADLLAEIVARPKDKRAAYADRLRKQFADRQAPAGRLELYQHTAPVEGNDAADPLAAPSYHDRALRHMRARPGTSYDDAVRHVQSQKG